jgi:radical SAM protein with 4Fe4S-binding SPASM domain
MTLTVHNLPFFEQSIRELFDMGFRSFSVIPDADSGSWEGHWDEYREQLERVWEMTTKAPITINFIQQTMEKLLVGHEVPAHLCQAGRNVIGITVEGALWPCHDFSGKFSKDPFETSKLQIGHVDKGYTLNTDQFEDMTCTDDTVTSGAGYDCKTCHARSICERGCPYINYAHGKEYKKVNATYCKTTRIHADIAMRFMIRDKNNFVFTTKKKFDEMVKPVISNSNGVSSQLTPYQAIAFEYYAQAAPFGRKQDGAPLLPGPGKLEEMGLMHLLPELQKAGLKLPSQPLGSPRSDLKEPAGSTETARWDGERGMPSQVNYAPNTPSGNTMNMAATPNGQVKFTQVPGLAPRV